MKIPIEIKYNTEIFQDLEEFVNKHQEDIERMTTQYDDDKKGLFVVTLKFYPVIVSNKEQQEQEDPVSTKEENPLDKYDTGGMVVTG